MLKKMNTQLELDFQASSLEITNPLRRRRLTCGGPAGP